MVTPIWYDIIVGDVRLPGHAHFLPGSVPGCSYATDSS